MQPAGEFRWLVAVTPLSAAAVRATGSDCSKFLSRQGKGQADNLGLATSELIKDEVENVARLVTMAHRGIDIASFDNSLEEAMTEESVLFVDRRKQRLFGTWFVGGEAIGQWGGFVCVSWVVGLIERHRDLARSQNGPETPRVDPELTRCLVERQVLAVLPETIVGRDNLPISVGDRRRRSDPPRVSAKIPEQRDIKIALGLVTRIGLVRTAPWLEPP